MTEYCKDGEKPKIKYQFNGGMARVYESKVSPITVEGKETPASSTDNYNQEGFKINYIITDGNQPRTSIVKDYKIIQPTSGSFGLVVWQCGKSKFEMDGSYVSIVPNSITIDTSIKCSPLSAKKRCSIIIKHKGIIIHQDQGDCPLTFGVQCGRCEDNEIECKSNKYPYYCCHRCEEMASKVRAIRF